MPAESDARFELLREQKIWLLPHKMIGEKLDNPRSNEEFEFVIMSEEEEAAYKRFF